MRIVLCAAALALLAGTAAAGEPAVNAAAAGKDAGAQAATRAVYICDSSAMTKRAFAREHGSAEFVTAKDVARGETWATPKCITAAEARRLRAGKPLDAKQLAAK